MFISYEYIGESGYVWKEKAHSYQFKIIDSEFEMISAGIYTDGPVVVEFTIDIIEVYEKRNLNVAANLMKAFIWYRKKHSHTDMAYIVSWNKEYNSKYSKYEKDIEKYLVLM